MPGTEPLAARPAKSETFCAILRYRPFMSSEDDKPGEPMDATAVAAKRAALVRGLRLYFRRHNIQAFILALFSLVAAAILWALIYVLVYWFCLVGATLAQSFNPSTLLNIEAPDLIGPNFPLYFAAGALLSLVIAGLVRKHWRPERLRDARFYLLWILAELLLSVPNVTFAIWGNLGAITRLRRRDAWAAARLLERLDASEGRLSLGSLRVEIEDEKTLGRLLFSLQLVGLVSVREKDSGWFLCLVKPETLALLSRSATATAGG